MPTVLQKRLAGLPAWAWIAVVAGGLTIGLVLRSRNAQSDNTDQTDATDTTDVVDSGYSDPTDAGYYVQDPGFTLGGAPASGMYGAYNLDEDYITQGIVDGLTKWWEDNHPDPVNPPSTTQKCTDANKPRHIPDGYKAVCRSDRWTIVPDKSNGGGEGKGHKGSGGKTGFNPIHGFHDDGKGNHGGKNGGGHKPGGKKTRTTVVTGGGPPRRRGVHTAGANARTGGMGRGGVAPR